MIYFVTGGSRGIGAAIVRQALREGHDVAFTYVADAARAAAVVEEARAASPGRACVAYQLDVRDSARVDEVGERVTAELGPVEVVVNNAGVSREGLAVAMSDEDWNVVLATNLSGPFYVCRQFLPGMLTRRFGRIVNIASISARGQAGQVNYAASKAGLVGLTRSLAKEYAKKGITANVLLPGWVDTDMTAGPRLGRARNAWLALCPQARAGTADEVAAVVTFLGSRASSFLNGAEIPVAGGLGELP